MGTRIYGLQCTHVMPRMHITVHTVNSSLVLRQPGSMMFMSHQNSDSSFWINVPVSPMKTSAFFSVSTASDLSFAARTREKNVEKTHKHPQHERQRQQQHANPLLAEETQLRHRGKPLSLSLSLSPSFPLSNQITNLHRFYICAYFHE